MVTAEYKVVISAEAAEMIAGISDLRIRGQAVAKLKGLAASPESQGRALTDELAGLRRITVAGRYRAVYRTLRMRREVHVLAVGVRREGDRDDIYRLMARMMRRGEV